VSLEHDVPSDAGEKRTVIEEGAELTGVFRLQHPLVVLGKLEGEISGPALLIRDGGVVAGRVKVGELRSSGEIGGEIDVQMAHLSGRVRDKTVLRTRTLELHSQHTAGMPAMFLDCEIEAGEVPSKDDLITAALKTSRERDQPVEVAPDPPKR
jgi:cytoskeletal protein CcmA (bactofilin family)